MKRLIMLAVLAGSSLCSLTAGAGEPQGQPQLQMPMTAPPAPVYPGYVIPQPIAPIPGMPGPAGCAGNCAGNSCAGDCGKQKNFFTKMKDWICYCPKAGDALPKLHVHPYVGPYCGTFYCTPTPGSGCGTNGNCNGCGSGAKTPRCNTGTCATGNPMILPGFSNRGCQGPSSTAAIPAVQQPFAIETNESATSNQIAPSEPESNLPIRLPQSNPETGQTPEVRTAPQSRLIPPAIPEKVTSTIITANHIATPGQTELADVANVEFRSVRFEVYFPRVEPEKKYVGAVLIAKQILTPMEWLSRP